MAKTKILNGLSYSLAHSFFSTLNYYEKGYMADWIVNLASELNINEVQIDILNKRCFPKEFEIRPLLAYLNYSNYIISKTLVNNDLEPDFIVAAIFDIKINADRQITCKHYTKGKNDRIYTSKDFIEKSYEVFTVLKNI